MSRPATLRQSPSAQVAAAPAAIRVTRRGRLVLVALVAALAFAVISLGQAALSPQAQAGSESSSDASRTWVVQPNETLWSIAEQVDPDTDPRETVARIVSMNDLPDSAVLVGQEIHVPA